MSKRLVSSKFVSGLALAFAVSMASTEVSATGGGSGTGRVAGDAYGVLVDLHALLGLIGVRVGPAPLAILPETGGADAEVLLGLSVPGVLGSQTLPAMTAGSVGPEKAGSASVAAVENLDLLSGLIRADAIVAACSSHSDGRVAVSDTSGSVLANLLVGGLPITVAAAPNTTIPLLDGFLKIGDIVLNEQIYAGDGVKTSAVQVNMLHVRIKDGGVLLSGALLKGDIVVGSAHCGVDASQLSGEPGGDPSITGSGTLGAGPEELATFAFSAKAGVGALQYDDGGANLKIESENPSLTSFTVSGTCAQFSGPARINNMSGYTYTVEACDNADPGVNGDTFTITGAGPGGFQFTRTGTLTGGNILLNN